jgi:hypothetical protein
MISKAMISIPRSNLLIGIIHSGVDMAFGSGYLYTYFWEPQNLFLLVLGIVVRCWAFISSLYCFLKKNISLQLFILIGLEAMLFAIAFTMYVISKGDTLTWN